MRLANICLAIVAVLTLGLASPVLAQTPPTTGAPPSPSGTTNVLPAVGEGTSSGYVLGRDDVVEVSLLGRNDFGGRARVQADGTIQLALIGKVIAAEHTTAELSDAIRKQLQTGGYFADPIVNIEVVSYASRYVTVLGSVGTPGLVPINRPYRLSEILARVGGVRADAADYLVVRPEKGPEKRLYIRDLATGDSTQDPYVAAGDKIYSPTAEVFYIYGQVNGPGAYPLVSDMTVRMAIAKAGGLTESGSDKKVDVTRGGKKAKLDTGAKLMSGDVLFIGERLF
jgi:polysaccharide export outer membrane protein